MAMMQYPDLTVEPITEGLRMVRAGTAFSEELPLTIKCGWTLAGVGAKIGFGEPNGPFAGSPAAADIKAATVAELQELQAAVNSQPALAAAPTGKGTPPSFQAALLDVFSEALAYLITLKMGS